MARPKGKLFALLAVFAAIGLVAASGAFTTVEADRSVDVNTAGDASALLSLDSTNSNNAADYVSGSGDEIQINLNTTNSAGGNGINQDAITDVDDLINITNQGSQEVDVHIVMDEGGSDLGSSDFNSSIDFTVDDSSSSATSVPDTLDRSSANSGSGSSVTLPVGESVTIGIEIDLTDVSTGSSDTILDDITIVANATA